MISKKVIKLTNRFYEAQESMKVIYGDQYDQKISDTKKVIRKFMETDNLNALAATTLCINIVSEKFHNNGLMVALLLATCVEMCES